MDWYEIFLIIIISCAAVKFKTMTCNSFVIQPAYIVTSTFHVNVPYTIIITVIVIYYFLCLFFLYALNSIDPRSKNNFWNLGQMLKLPNFINWGCVIKSTDNGDCIILLN